jgi:hypothetical protein
MPQPDQFDDLRSNAPGLLCGDPGVLKGARNAPLALFQIRRRTGAVADPAGDNRCDALGLLPVDIGVG